MNRKIKRYMVVMIILCFILLLSSCTSKHSSKVTEVTSVETSVETNVETSIESSAETSVTEEQVLVETLYESTQELDIIGFSLDQLQEDFEKIKTTMVDNHPKLYTDIEEMETLIENQFSQLKEGMTALDFYRIVAPIISASRCGHTYIGLSEQDSTTFMESAKFLPFSLYWQNNIALVNANALIPQLPIGSQILSINEVKIEEVMDGLLQNLAADGENQTLKIRTINDGFRYHYAMDNITPSEMNIVYIDPIDGVSKLQLIQTVSNADIEAAGDSLWGYMSQLSWDNKSIFEKDYALLRMASFYPSGRDSIDSYNAFIDDFFAQVKEKKVQNVVIDVRDNFGGDPYVAAHLLSYLENEEVPYFEKESGAYYPQLTKPIPIADVPFDGNLYVLINGNCFSTTGHFLALLKYHGIGTLIGEESGASYACSDASATVNLEHTKLIFKSSRRIFKVAVEGLTPGRGIFPDYTVVATLDDILSRKDIEMSKVLELIEND